MKDYNYAIVYIGKGDGWTVQLITLVALLAMLWRLICGRAESPVAAEARSTPSAIVTATRHCSNMERSKRGM